MASSIMHLSVLSCLLALLAATAASAPALAPPPLSGLAQRLEGEGSQQCWEALVEVKSCTGEIVLYLLNGEAYLGPGCCRAIRVIEQSCWAADAMLSAIGFTPEEGDMLKGYCDAGDDNGGGQHGPPPPAATGGVAARESVAAAAERKSALGAPLIVLWPVSTSYVHACGSSSDQVLVRWPELLVFSWFCVT